MKLALQLLISLLVFILLGCGNPEKESEPDRTSAVTTEKQSLPNLGEAPDFEKRTLDGRTVRLSEYRGKVVILNFWATWCAPCRREIPELIKLQDEFEGVLEVIGVSLDEEGFEVVRPYAEQREINYPVILDDYSYGDKLGGIYMVPTTFIIDREGMITARRVGEISREDIYPLLEKLL